ncbi:MAG TPA: 5-oxoprolinase subunit PxpB [Bacillota bacterium]|nr:5-oxoprolinase subunit PxpB [Bacillota bacterium]HOR86225.1 5-oxoprolinase subunit PxpB [Bacillota bacterium]
MSKNQKGQHCEISYINAGDSCVIMMLGNEISREMHQRVKSLYLYLNSHQIPGVVEVVPAYRSISVYYNPFEASPNKIFEWLQQTDGMVLPNASENSVRRLYIPVCFGGEFGPDLQRVAEYHNLSEKEVVDIFQAQYYLNYFVGFMPGKPYLGGLPEILETPRLDVPRFKLPSGTVVIYSKQAAIFGIEQPSGANCIGRSPILIYDIRKEDPTLFQMGDMVRFFPISQEEFLEISAQVEAMEYHVRTEYVKE